LVQQLPSATAFLRLRFWEIIPAGDVLASRWRQWHMSGGSACNSTTG
jgi:hypothetical protein